MGTREDGYPGETKLMEGRDGEKKTKYFETLYLRIIHTSYLKFSLILGVEEENAKLFHQLERRIVSTF